MVATVKEVTERAREALVLSQISRRVRRRKLTYLTVERLRALEFCSRRVNRSGVPGDFLEAGVALGGSAIVLASLMGADRRFHGYDVFEMIPPPGESDPVESHARYAMIASGRSSGIGEETYYGYLPNLYERVVAEFAELGTPVDGDRVQLHRGLFEQSLHPPGPVALAHIDSDWYESVATCLARIAPQLSTGGFVVLDDYFDFGGCRKAADEFLAGRDDIQIVRRAGNVVLRRLG
jgi:O-methyltransferase